MPSLLEILLPIHESESALPARLRVHITLNVQLATETLRAAEEDTSFTRRMQFLDTLEDHVPLRPSKIRWRRKTCDGVRRGAVEHDVLGVGG